jgi:hypothetical protein
MSQIELEQNSGLLLITSKYKCKIKVTKGKEIIGKILVMSFIKTIINIYYKRKRKWTV